MTEQTIKRQEKIEKMFTEGRLERIEKMLATSEGIENIATEFSLLVNCGLGGGSVDFIEYFEDSEVAHQITEIAVRWLETCADNSYVTDGRNEASKIAAKIILRHIDVNEYCCGETTRSICAKMKTDHRTLQQNFTRMMINWLYNQCIISERPELPYI